MTTQRPADPQQLNLYAYVRNNPLRYNDPYGLDLYATGEEAGRFKKDLEKATGLKLKLDSKTGKITIDGKTPKNMSDAAMQVQKIIGDSKNTVSVNAIRDSSPHDYVGGKFEGGGLTESGPGKTVLDFHKTGISYENMVRADRGLGA